MTHLELIACITHVHWNWRNYESKNPVACSLCLFLAGVAKLLLSW